VVKFQNNPQHTRVLVNDWLGTRLAEMIGLPVPVTIRPPTTFSAMPTGSKVITQTLRRPSRNTSH